MIKRINVLLSVLALFVISTSFVYAQSNVGRLYFDPDSIETPNGTEFVTDVYLDTAGYDAAGVGAILRYNPIFLEAVRIEPGIIFDDYPLAVIDNTAGKVLISGVSGSKNNLYNGRDVFAKVVWVSKKTGLSEISFDFEPGSTTDSNIAVTFGNGDILGSVNTFNATVLVGNGTIASTPPVVATTSGEGSILDKGLDKLSSIFGKDPEGDIDPYAPITRRDPVTDLSQTAGEDASFASQGSKLPVALAAVIIAIAVLVLVLIIIVVRKMKNRRAPTVVTQNFDPNAPQPPIPPNNN